MRKLLRLCFLLALIAIGRGSINAEEVVFKTLEMSAATKEEAYLYTETWKATIGTDEWVISNFSNNRNYWTNYIKCGRKNTAAVASITNAAAYEAAITKVVVTYYQVKTAPTTTYLEVASDADFKQNVQKIEIKSIRQTTGLEDFVEYTYTIPKPTANSYYRLTVETPSYKSSGQIWISKLVYYKDDAISKPEEKVTVTSAGWATYVTGNAVSFPEGVTAYTVTYDGTGDRITLHPVTSVPAKTAVVLKAEAGTYTLTQVESADAPASNNLTYSETDKTIAEGDNIYVLAQSNGVIGFWPVTVGTTVATFKGYLDLGTKTSSKSHFALDGTATGINSLNADKANNDILYNIAGQRVGKNYKGVVIVNGKKVLVK